MLTLQEAAELTRIPVKVLERDVKNGTILSRGPKDDPLVSRTAVSVKRYNPNLSVTQGAAYIGLRPGTLRQYCRTEIPEAVLIGAYYSIPRSALDTFNARDKLRSGRPRNSEIGA